MVFEFARVCSVYALTVAVPYRPLEAIVAIVVVCLSGHPGFWGLVRRLELVSIRGLVAHFRGPRRRR